MGEGRRDFHLICNSTSCEVCSMNTYYIYEFPKALKTSHEEVLSWFYSWHRARFLTWKIKSLFIVPGFSLLIQTNKQKIPSCFFKFCLDDLVFFESLWALWSEGGESLPHFLSNPCARAWGALNLIRIPMKAKQKTIAFRSSRGRQIC